MMQSNTLNIRLLTTTKKKKKRLQEAKNSKLMHKYPMDKCPIQLCFVYNLAILLLNHQTDFRAIADVM
jgi:hypothetical protein